MSEEEDIVEFAYAKASREAYFRSAIISVILSVLGLILLAFIPITMTYFRYTAFFLYYGSILVLVYFYSRRTQERLFEKYYEEYSKRYKAENSRTD